LGVAYLQPSFTQKRTRSNVTAEANGLNMQNGNAGVNHAVRERCIYPNLKLRVYTTGMRQNRLAKLVGIDEAYLSRIINGVRVPGKQMQEQISSVLGCDAEWLFQQTTIQVPVQNGNGAKHE
jgi:plasmid maintenance system antidote protein VapI